MAAVSSGQSSLHLASKVGVNACACVKLLSQVSDGDKMAAMRRPPRSVLSQTFPSGSNEGCPE